MPSKLRVVVNTGRDPNSDPFPVTEPVEWIRTDYIDNKPSPQSLRGAHVYIGTDFTKEMGAAADSLRAILIPAAGYDRIDPHAVPQGCTVANAYHHEAPIAEWVMAVAVALDHELFKSERTFRAGSWEMWPGRHGSYRELMGRTFGIIGFGAIGRRVAKLANAYEMPVIAAGRTETASGDLHGAKYIGGGKQAREHVIANSDFVLISTPLGPATEGLIGKPRTFVDEIHRIHHQPRTRTHHRRIRALQRTQKPHHRWSRYRHLVPLPRIRYRRATTRRPPLLGTRQHHHGPPTTPEQPAAQPPAEPKP